MPFLRAATDRSCRLPGFPAGSQQTHPLQTLPGSLARQYTGLPVVTLRCPPRLVLPFSSLLFHPFAPQFAARCSRSLRSRPRPGAALRQVKLPYRRSGVVFSHGEIEGSCSRNQGGISTRALRASAIDNLSHLGDVGETDISLLKRILPHCNADQLMHIETSTTGRDLSPITDELWRKCYARKFGNDAVDMVKERMANRNCKFKWKQLYQAKLREQEEVQKKGVNRLRELYKEQDTQKQSRKLKPCDVKPPESKRRKSGPGGSSAPASKFAKSKGRLMQKSRMDYANSNEVKMQASMRNKAAGGNGLNQRPGGQSSGRRV